MSSIRIDYSKSSDAAALYELMDSPPEGEHINLNLSAVKRFKPNEIILLVMFIIYMVKYSNTIELGLPTSKIARNYLEEIDLLKFCKKNLRQPSTITAINSQTAMPIRRLTEHKMGEYIDSAEQYFKSICEGKDLTMLNLCMAELLNNVYNHSKSPIDAYVFCQYFSSMNKIYVVVGDYGIGIPEAVNQYLVKEKEIQSPLSDIDSVAWAIQLNNSSKSIPKNQGKGLDNVLSFAKSNGGNVFIYSNSAFMRANGENGFSQIIEENYIDKFRGTIVVFTIDVEGLEEIDDELIDFDL